MTPEAEIRLELVAERTLGRLATWLRLLGHDVVWEPQLAGRALLARGRRQGRIVLTRSARLARGSGPPRRIRVVSNDFREQLSELAAQLPIGAGRPFSRCARCNRALVATAPAMVSARVPPYVLQTQRTFRVCPGCARVYWAGTHQARMWEELAGIGIVS